MRHIHFIGIGGVGMNGLAQLAALSDYSVSGSDRAYNPEAEPFRSLGKLGIQIFPQDGSGISADTKQVVYSTAIESDNPDIQQCNRHKFPSSAHFFRFPINPVWLSLPKPWPILPGRES